MQGEVSISCHIRFYGFDYFDFIFNKKKQHININVDLAAYFVVVLKTNLNNKISTNFSFDEIKGMCFCACIMRFATPPQSAIMVKAN